MTQNNNKVEIIMADISNQTNDNQRKSYVVPGHIEVVRKNKEVITWEARDSNATFYFPKAEIFGKKEYQVTKGETLSLPVKENAPLGSFPYAVFTDNDDFAEGGSFPRVIIR